ncbi:MAG TPA: penicillin-binding transpeptidase domain-containing protein [Polyangiaceae bacterium]|nr:penicillin-binding transpeptidase domain-containing protein [Polyangiaceae bacterium]
MTVIFALGVVFRGSLLLALSLAVLPALRGTSAALRRWLILLGLTGSLSVPLLAWTFPGRPVVHVASPALVGRVVAEALSPAIAPASLHTAQHASAQPAPRPFGPRSWLFSIWAVGALFVAARVLRGAWGAWRLSAEAAPGQAGVRVSSGIESPLVVGILRPIVLLPTESGGWSDERRHAVLLHEFAHVHRYDGLALLVAQLCCALYWFQPLAWIARNQLRRECELAADEAVIAAGVRPTSYARHLLEIARGLVPAGGIAMAARPSELAGRIQVLVSRDRLPRAFTRARAALIGSAALVVLGGVACMGAEAKPALSPTGVATPAKTGDARLQAIADDEAQRVRGEWGAERVAILVLDPKTGALLASSDDAPGQPIVPASTLKPLSVALALDADLITPEQRFDCGNGSRSYDSLVLRDGGSYGSLNAAEILAVSSNVGSSRIFDLLGGQRLGDGLRRFHIDAPPDIPSGTMRGAIIAIGEGSTTTPLALASAYGVFANDGLYASVGNGAPERVIKSSTAQTLRSMLEGVVNGERATGKAAAVAGTRVGGKTGTSDPDCCVEGSGSFANFVGIVPIEAPRWVIYVGVGRPTKQGSGGTIAAPAFSRVATRALAL